MEIKTKIFNEKEYLLQREVEYNNSKYSIWIDTEKRDSAVVLDKNENKIEDRKTINGVMEKVFKKHSDIHYEINSDSKQLDIEDYMDFDILQIDDFKEEKDATDEKEITGERREELITEAKEMFIKRFGNKILSNEELDERIRKNIKSIKLVYSDYFAGQYNENKKSISLNENWSSSTFFHEFIHGLVHPGGIKEIHIGEDESYEYGRGLDEGIVTWIQAKAGNNDISYVPLYCIVNQLKILYDNVKTDEYDFIGAYIREPERMLERVNEIFEDYTRNTARGLNQRDIELESMRDSLDFVVKTDDLCKLYMGSVIEDEDNYSDMMKLLQSIEKKLYKIYGTQMVNREISSNLELINSLEEIYDYKEKTMNSYDVYPIVSTVIDKYLMENPEETIDDIIEENRQKRESEKRLLCIMVGISEDEFNLDIEEKIEFDRYKEEKEKNKETKKDGLRDCMNGLQNPQSTLSFMKTTYKEDTSSDLGENE